MALHNNIFYFDPCSKRTLSYDGKEFIPDVTFSKNDFVSSRILYEDMTSHSFKVSKETSKEEINSLVELKMYEEAGLDLGKEYKMTYVIKDLEFDNMLLIESFAVEKSKITERIQDILDVSGYVDFLAIPFLSFSTLYTNKIIAPKNDVFVYIEENEAFLTIYKDGHFLSTKSLFTLNEMLDKLRKNDITLDTEALATVLKEKGLDSTLYTKEDAPLFTALENIFSELFTKINNVIIHSRSIFGFEKIDRLFFSTHIGRTKGLKEIALNFFSPDLRLMDFNLFKEKIETGFFERIVASYVYDVLKVGSIEQDITFFHKKPPFFKTKAGQFVGFTVVFFILLALYPLYLKYDISNLQKQDEQVTNQLNIVNENTKKIRDNLTKVRSEISFVEEELKAENIRAQKVSKSINELYKLKSNQQKATDFFVQVNALLAKYSLAVKSVELSDIHTMKIEVVTTFQKRDTIAKFMKDLITHGFVGVTTQEIKLDESSYISVVEISR